MSDTLTILIAYYSKGGNTRKMAEAVAEGVSSGGADPIIRSVEEVTKEDMLSCKGMIVGSPVYFGTMAAPVKEFLDKYVGLRQKMENKIGAAFACSAHHTGGKETTIMSILQGMLIYGMIIVGDPLAASGHYGVACHEAVTNETLRHCSMLGGRVADVARKIHSS